MAVAKDMRSVYIEDPEWDALKIEAATKHTNVSAIIREVLRQRRERMNRRKAGDGEKKAS